VKPGIIGVARAMKVCPRCHLEYHDDDHDVCVMDGTPLEVATDPRIGKLVLGRYVIDAQLGAGGMATVYRAHESTTGRQVAVKVMHANLARDRDLRERFRREARIAAALVHENIVEIFDAGETEDHEPVIVMALLAGRTLREVVAKGPMPLGLVVALGVQIARALARAHDLGVVHRDLKPENVFVVDEGGRRTAKLVDFGIARARHETRLTAAGTMVGTPAYLAPERIKGRENDPSSDLYSFGIVLYEMITGALPFQCASLPAFVIAHLDTPAPSPMARVAACPKPLDSLVLRLLAKDPSDRPVDAHSVVRDLETIRFLVGPAPIDRDSAPPQPPRPSRASQAVTLERWERRALLLEQMLRRAFRQGDAPTELVRTLDDLRDAVVELETLRKERLSGQQTIDDADASAREAGERLGHAVHELGVDLSEAREALGRLRAELDARDAQVKDLEFQIDVLRKKLDESQNEAHAQRATAQEALAASGARIESLRRAIGQHSRLLLGALREHPDNRELVEELERA
jgi:serine/threonine protein kinase